MIKIRKMVGSAIIGMGALLLFSAVDGNTRVSAQPSSTGDAADSGVMRVASRDIGSAKNVRIFPGKSVVLELPKAVRDVLIASPDTLDAVVHTPKRVYLIGKKVGQTNAVFFGADGERILTLNVEVGGGKFHDLERVFERIMPGNNINIESVGNTILLTGTVKTPIESSRAGEIAHSYFAEFKDSVSSGTAGGGKSNVANEGEGKKTGKVNIVNMLAVEAKEQVMLKVQVVEMNRKIVKQLGVDLAATATAGNMTFSMLSSTPFAALGKDLIPGGVVGGNTMSNGALMTGTRGTFGISKMLKAMEQNGVVKTLAEPNLTAISGETAKFHAGGEFPIPISSDDGKITIDWKKFGVLLNFTPVVLSEGRISLQIKSEISELSQEGSITVGYLTLPGISTRNAESTVELPSGGSMMMAGLISDKTQQSVSGLPGLKNLPVLGTLFKSRDYIRNETELVVLVTPYMVKPISNRKLTTPDAGFAEASDAKANLLGHFNRVYGRRGRMPKGRQHGDYGFIVE